MVDQNMPETASKNTGMIVGIIAVLVIVVAAILIYASMRPSANNEASMTNESNEVFDETANDENEAMNVEVETNEGSVNVTNTNTPVETKKAGFTAADVSSHNSVSSCYVIVGEGVYDLTDWISKHPGGADNIIKLCGTDGTELFTKQHGSFQKAKDTLASYMIGDLVK